MFYVLRFIVHAATRPGSLYDGYKVGQRKSTWVNVIQTYFHLEKKNQPKRANL